jgi:hypothetical protein
MVCPLEDHITPKSLQEAGAEWMGADSDFFSSVAIVIPAAVEDVFLTTYHTLDSTAVPMGPDGRRESQKGSPVVPRSARKLASDREGYLLYTVLVLKPFLDSFRAAVRERRWVVRDFAYVPGLAGSGKKTCDDLAKEVTSALNILKDFARRKFEESLGRWMHVKMIRVHVDSVLRYGLPVNYQAWLLCPLKGTSPALFTAALKSAWKLIAGAAGEFDAMYEPPAAPGAGGGGGEEEEEEGLQQNLGPDPTIPGITDAAGGGAGAPGTPPLPFVFVELDVRGDTAASTAASSGGGGGK